MKGRAKRAGIDRLRCQAIAASGYVTSAVEHGAAPRSCGAGRHKSLDMLLVYSRRVGRYRNHSGWPGAYLWAARNVRPQADRRASGIYDFPHLSKPSG